MIKPLFSVLIANYNRAEFLADCLDSVCKQTYSNWEIICIDDYSTDNSMDIIQKYANHDSRIHFFQNEKNSGCGYTKARCAYLASGEFCGFLDSDDALLPSAIEIMVERHIAFPNVSIVYSRHFLCDQNLHIRDISKDYTNAHFTSQLETPIIFHFAVFKNNLYKKTEGIDPSMLRAVDQDLYLKLEETGPVLFINLALYLYRNNKKSISLRNNNYKAKAWGIYTIIKTCNRRGLSLDSYCDILKPPSRFNIIRQIPFLYSFLCNLRGKYRLHTYYTLKHTEGHPCQK
jgi:glycosyltransferase involved in cell wall biosynthesis